MREEELIKSLELYFDHFCDRAQSEDMLKEQQIYQQIKKLIQVDPEEIIQVVLSHLDCHRVHTHDEDGHHVHVDYDVKDGCHEAVRKVLGVER